MIQIFFDESSRFVAIGGQKIFVPPNVLAARANDADPSAIDIYYKLFPSKFLYFGEKYQVFGKADGSPAGGSVEQVLGYLNGAFSQPLVEERQPYLEFSYTDQTSIRVEHFLDRWVKPEAIAPDGEVRTSAFIVHLTKNTVSVNLGLPESGTLILFL